MTYKRPLISRLRMNMHFYTWFSFHIIIYFYTPFFRTVYHTLSPFSCYREKIGIMGKVAMVYYSEPSSDKLVFSYYEISNLQIGEKKKNSLLQEQWRDRKYRSYLFTATFWPFPRRLIYRATSFSIWALRLLRFVAPCLMLVSFKDMTTKVE